MQQQYIIAISWLVGFLLSFWMLKVEHEAEEEEYTNGDKVLQVILSILSIVMVLYLLVQAWSKSVKKYWGKPIRQAEALKQKDK